MIIQIPGLWKYDLFLFRGFLRFRTQCYSPPFYDYSSRIYFFRCKSKEICQKWRAFISPPIEAGDFCSHSVKNDKKDSAVRVFEKVCRPQGINVSFCQNAFDNAFTKLSNRLNAIRVDMFRRHQTIFTQSKVLFAMFLQSATKKEMSDAMQSIADHLKKKKEFYLECAEKLSSMSDKAFSDG